jgi:2'-5' RNA ligase
MVRMQQGRHYIFFAIRPDPATAEQICRLAAELRRSHGLTGLPVAAERLHISLNFVDNLATLDAGLIDRARAAAARVVMPPFVVALDRVGSWGRGAFKPVVLAAEDGVIGADLLHGKIHSALVSAGLGPRAEPVIAPHMTLLRDAAQLPMAFIDPLSWRVETFVLLDSVRGEGRHEVLGCWPLASLPNPAMSTR